jgi:hypothetical protein
MKKGTKRIHTKDKYYIYYIACERCNAHAADSNDRDSSIRWALDKGFRNHNGENLCPDCLEKI